jgi:hypothetical protein
LSAAHYSEIFEEEIQEAVAPGEKWMQDLEQENQQLRAEVARLIRTGIEQTISEV